MLEDKPTSVWNKEQSQQAHYAIMLVDIRERLARIEVKVDTIAAVEQDVRALTIAISEHEIEDAEVQANLTTDLKRLWWGVGGVTLATVTALIQVVIQ